jgi:hypothetical protein
MLRTLTFIATGFLTLDGAALTVFGFVSGRPRLLVLGSVFLASAGIVLLSWRWYRHTLEAILAERAALAEDARRMRNDVRAT